MTIRLFLTTLVMGLWTCCLTAASIELVYSGPSESNALNGLQLGIQESHRQGEFLGVEFNLVLTNSDSLPAAAIAVFADRRGAIPQLAAKAGKRALLNLSDTSDSLRASCLANVLHVIPSDKMKADATAQWRQEHTDAVVSAAAWHGSAVKFAARDLNKRYMNKFGAAMDEQAWSGWFAARAVADTLMRNPGADASELLETLKGDSEFDGQKGDPHSFRQSGQLRQPLVLISSDGELLGEAPVRGVATELDSLGSLYCE